MRILLPVASLMIPEDDVSITTPVSTPTASADVGTPRPTLRPIAAHYYAVSDVDALGSFIGAHDEGEIAQPAPDCTDNEPNIIVDGTVAVVGAIALDVAPTGVVTECPGLIKPNTISLFAPSCSVEASSAQLDVANE